MLSAYCVRKKARAAAEPPPSCTGAVCAASQSKDGLARLTSASGAKSPSSSRSRSTASGRAARATPFCTSSAMSASRLGGVAEDQRMSFERKAFFSRSVVCPDGPPSSSASIAAAALLAALPLALPPVTGIASAASTTADASFFLSSSLSLLWFTDKK